MPRSDLQRIKEARTDVSDWVIHWTRELDSIKLILQCGYFRPTFAHRYRTDQSYSTNSETIKGSEKAVCFTEQTVRSFIQSCRALPDQYKPYGIAVEKRSLYKYGGRPVIYGDYSLLKRLSEEDQYLWNNYSPIQTHAYPNSYPSDWTHEREWRTRVRNHDHIDWGKTP